MSKKKNVKPTPVRPVTKKPETKNNRNTRSTSTPSVQLPGPWWFGLICAGFGFILYANTFGYDFCLDDFSAIKENWVVKGGLKNLGIIFSTEYRYGAWASPGSLYRPLSLAMFAFEWQLAPDNPGFYHMMNAVYYGISGWVFWITWRRILAQYPVALTAIAVLVFMALPVHSEVVANIKSRDEIMSLMFASLALYSIWRHFEKDSAGWLITAMACYAAALFSKESAITFLAIIPLTIWFFTDKPLSKIAQIGALLLIPAGLFLLIRHQVLAAQSYNEIYSPLDNFIVAAPNTASRFASAFMMCFEYLKVLIFPISLVSDRGFPQLRPVGFDNWEALLGFFLYGAMFVWAVLNLKKKHFLSYAILIYLIAFSLFSNVLLVIGTSYGERLLYMPSLGFALAIAYGISRFFKIDENNNLFNPNGKGSVIWGIACVIIAGYALRTLVRNPAWENSASLYNADIIQSPNSAKLNYHNGLEQVKTGMDEKTGVVTDSTWVLKGIGSYNKAIELFPEYHDAFGSRGLAYFRLNKFDQAYTDYLTSLKHRPNDAKVLSNLGFIYFMRNQFDKAEEVYRKSIQYDPRFIDARRNLGAILAMKKQFPAAIEQWQEGLKYEPRNATLLFYVGSAYRDMGQPEKAQTWFEQAYAIDPSLQK
ncbi:MAG: tetratricopeptide repeat protein [Saprospiraceae bacterium]|nr:tetratricopeptide repeat protein [Saprospiraceae bacterium]